MKGLSIHLTDQCNNSCIFCVVDSHKNRGELVNLDIITNFLNSNAGKDYECVNIHGGEPTICLEFMSILKKIQDLGYPWVSLQTNGRTCKDMDFTKKAVELGVNLFVISLHGKTREMQDYLAGDQGCFEETVQGIKNIKSLGVKVRTNTVVCKQNYKELKDIVEYSMDLGTDHINISGIHPTGKAYKNFHNVTPMYTDIIPYVKEAVDAAVKRNKVVTLEGFPPCMLGEYEKYIINWDEIKYKLLFHNIILPNYDTYMEKETRKQGTVCKNCDKNKKCGGVYKEYLEFYGWDEFEPKAEKTPCRVMEVTDERLVYCD